ncbi:MAG: MBL fold metallo-hydrolase [Gemmatimonadaceae bacterium]|nr:MBL fold metallo-hydrolase [Gemmatimonadaceae bacterium]
MAELPLDVRARCPETTIPLTWLRVGVVRDHLHRPNMEIEFAGADREVTGSCHIVRVNGKTVLLDCGLYQGHRGATDVKNRALPCPIETIDAVVLSHAHLDHSGRLPFLVSHGYSRPIHATKATADLTAIMLADSAHIQESDFAFLTRHGRPVAPPLYGLSDAAQVEELVQRHPYEEWFDVCTGLRARFTDAGHILGSASIVLEATNGSNVTRLIFSGDIGRAGLPIIRDPVPPPDAADIVIMESTYGNRDHESVASSREHLGRVVRETSARGGRLLIPAFAVGRTQELVYDLQVLARAKEIPPIRIVIDSPLATAATGVFERNTDVFDRSEGPVREIESLFRFERLSYTSSTEESKALNTRVGPMVIIAGSGMVEGGRILHHLLNGAANARNTILIVGFQAENTLGRRIVERRPVIRVLGTEVELRANVEIINGYSAHADRTELETWIGAVRHTSPKLRQLYLVHGEVGAQTALSETLTRQGYRVRCPELHEKISC